MIKNEIWVCNQCSGSWDSLEKYVLKMKNGGFISCCPDSNPRPYLPSSSVKDLVKAAKDVVNENKTKYPILGKGVISIDTLKKLEAALGERKD